MRFQHSKISKYEDFMPHLHNTKAQEISTLPFGEHLALWCFRIWALNFRKGGKSKNLLLRGLRLAGVAEAYADFDELMMLVAYFANRNIEINCISDGNLSIDEHLLLDAIAFWMVKGDIHTPPFSNFDFLPLAAAKAAERHLCKIACAFKASGHWIRKRDLLKPRDQAAKNSAIASNYSMFIH